eukprot:m.65354 g.65354  ORF g.65354 m.65354 type:complete len:534 (+) comp49789_c0_seq1:3-1604(+)
MLELPLLWFVVVVGGVLGSTTVYECDVVIAGGSASALAAALASSQYAPAARVCLTEPTDWLGGQLTTQGVSAIDFGKYNVEPTYQPLSFRSLTEDITGSMCWVSEKCFLPAWLAGEWIPSHLANHPNLTVIYRTVITGVQRDASGRVLSLLGVKRTPVDPANEWSYLLSDILEDWYSPVNSAVFTKALVNLTAPVFIEAEEFADLMMLANVSIAQGAETPFENSTGLESQCGQAITIPIFMTLENDGQTSPSPPAGSNESYRFDLEGGYSWDQVWTYRRAYAPPGAQFATANPGDTSQQNIAGGNDYDGGYIYLPLDQCKAQIAAGHWSGCLNITTLKAAEQRAYGWYWWFKNASDANITDHLFMNYTQPGTLTGLTKLPYLRDARRSVGLDGFRLMYTNMINGTNAGYQFYDTVALGDYPIDIHPLNGSVCTYPSYIYAEHPVLPYYIPFRSLTNEDIPNMLVSGKGIAQTFLANSATRLHPTEWSTGVAAGVAAVLMATYGWSSAEALENVSMIQAALQSQAIQQPLQWNL